MLIVRISVYLLDVWYEVRIVGVLANWMVITKFVDWTSITQYGLEVSGEFWKHEQRTEEKKVELMSIFYIYTIVSDIVVLTTMPNKCTQF